MFAQSHILSGQVKFNYKINITLKTGTHEPIKTDIIYLSGFDKRYLQKFQVHFNNL